jgi:hypothetical protein
MLALLTLAGSLSAIPIGDTLTVIVTPLPNIPTIVIPGEDIIIDCKAAASTSNWQAQLIHGNTTIQLPLEYSAYDPNIQRWHLGAVAPTPSLFEIYDLKVTASGGLSDIAKHCVNIIPERKTGYFFVQITDAHMPTTTYSYEGATFADSTCMDDMREVIHDINLIHPEFVLFTGDLINEGELEDYNGMRYYTRVQKILNEFDVPVFVTAGNHDIGGWNATPPSDGTARRNWWRFFGWRFLGNPPSGAPARTQDYSFDYGPVHYVGLEAYDNYDEWMYSIYGDCSFRQAQMNWLEDNLDDTPASASVVLFYHYDFSGQLDLSELGADLGLYGHGHQNQGSINDGPPWCLETDNLGAGTRAYRPIRVNGATLAPKNTLYAGQDGDNMEVDFFPGNTGSADSVAAVVQNHQGLTFDSARLKFLMPNDGTGFRVHNGTLDQVDRSGHYAVCYVSFNLPANTTRTVSVASTGTSNDDPGSLPALNLMCYPNPFAGETSIRFSTGHPAEVSIYNLRGQLVRQWSRTTDPIQWDGRDTRGVPAAPGVYLVRAGDGHTSAVKRLLLTR